MGAFCSLCEYMPYLGIQMFLELGVNEMGLERGLVMPA